MGNSSDRGIPGRHSRVVRGTYKAGSLKARLCVVGAREMVGILFAPWRLADLRDSPLLLVSDSLNFSP